MKVIFLPFAVLLSIPTGPDRVCSYFISLTGIENNIYVQVGIIMLIGLLAKNAILIVQYAVQRRRSGMDLVAAAIEAARLRLRPILMTSFAFIVGSASTDVGHRGIRSWKPFHWYRRRGRNAHGRAAGCIYHTGAFCDLPGFPGESYW